MAADLKLMDSYYGGECAHCHNRFDKGVSIRYNKATRQAFHADCETVATPAPAKPAGLRLLQSSLYHGRCAGCGGRYFAGDPIMWSKATGGFHPGHEQMELPMGIDLTVLPEGPTRYAVQQGDKKLVFIKVDRIPDSKPVSYAGNIYVKEQHGPSTGDRLGRQLKGQTYVGAKADVLQSILQDPEAAAKRYATELGLCYRCNSELTDEASRATGVGPDCWEKLHGRTRRQADWMAAA
jgi:hypothetical protein